MLKTIVLYFIAKLFVIINLNYTIIKTNSLNTCLRLLKILFGIRSI